MAITAPASKDCQECRGKGQTIDPDGNTHACETCWHEGVKRWLAPQMGEIKAEFARQALKSVFSQYMVK